VVKVLKQDVLEALLQAIRARDAELRALIGGSIEDLIPPPVDALELRGPSWTGRGRAGPPP
jgi:hypothetical protein